MMGAVVTLDDVKATVSLSHPHVHMVRIYVHECVSMPMYVFMYVCVYVVATKSCFPGLCREL